MSVFNVLGVNNKIIFNNSDSWFLRILGDFGIVNCFYGLDICSKRRRKGRSVEKSSDVIPKNKSLDSSLLDMIR